MPNSAFINIHITTSKLETLIIRVIIESNYKNTKLQWKKTYLVNIETSINIVSIVKSQK